MVGRRRPLRSGVPPTRVATTGRPAGQFQNGHVAAVENTYGKGRTLLIGSFPGAGYFRKAYPFFADLLQWAGIRRQVFTGDRLIKARLHQGAGGNVLYVVNPTREERTVSINLPLTVLSAEDLWQKRPVKADGHRLLVTVEERNVAVIRFQ